VGNNGHAFGISEGEDKRHHTGEPILSFTDHVSVPVRGSDVGGEALPDHASKTKRLLGESNAAYKPLPRQRPHEECSLSRN
jgi:hypothetical protein